MSDSTIPTFEEWAEYCFTRGYADFQGEADDDHQYDRMVSLDPVTLTAYLTRLFESPSWVAERYTDDQIADATWFIFGIASEYLGDVRREPVPLDAQARCLRAVATLYIDLYDRVCGNYGRDPDLALHNSRRVDGAVYMIWDMDYLEGALYFPHQFPHLVEPSIQILEAAIALCRTSACVVSALHGIGHVYCYHNNDGNRAIAERMQALVDGFLTGHPSAPEWLRDYAARARRGAVL